MERSVSFLTTVFLPEKQKTNGKMWLHTARWQ